MNLGLRSSLAYGHSEFARKAHQGLEDFDTRGLNWKPGIVQMTKGGR